MTKSELENLRACWRERVVNFHASGLSGAAWCTAHGLKEHQLWYWVQKFRAEQQPKQVVAPKWTTVEVSDTEPDGSTLSIRIGQAIIDIRPGFDPKLLSDVMRTLATLC